MWGQFFTDYELGSIKRYKTLPFENDFYKYFLKTNHSITCNVADYYPDFRQKLKDNIMYFLYDDNVRHRYHNEYIKMFRDVFPGVDKWICTLHKLIGSDRFSYLLQKTESYLMLDVISREFHERYPMAPVYTIHDAICTYPEYLPDLKGLILGRFYEITGIKVGLKESHWKANPEPKSEDIDEEWQKIKSVNSIKRYNEESYQILSSNIEKGSSFLFHQQGITSCNIKGS